MRRQYRLYNVIFPVWVLMFWPSPPVILLTLLGNLAMDLSVNLSLCGKAATVLWAVWTSFSLWALPPGQAPDTSLSQSFGYIAAPILLALAVTAFTQYLLYRWSGLDASLPRLRLCLRRPGWPALLGLVPLLACLFWALFPTLCRACYTCLTGEQISKRKAAQWAKNRFPEYRALIAQAEEWTRPRGPADDPARQFEHTRAFIGFACGWITQNGVF